MPSDRPCLVAWAAAGPGVGAGHLVRTWSLARTWCRAGGRAVVAAPTSARSFEVLVGEGSPMVSWTAPDDPSALHELVDREHPDWVVLDGYSLGEPWRDAARRTGARLAVIDDGGITAAAGADLVVDSGPRSRSSDYPDTGRALLGPRYALVRPGPIADVQPPPGDARVAVIFGGAGSDEMASLVMGAMPAWGAREVVAVDPAGCLGAVRGVDVLGAVPDVRPVIESASVVVAAAGSVTWEIARAGRPAVLVTTAGNQVPVARAAATAGFGIDLGAVSALAPAALARAVEELLTDPPRRAAMGRAGATLIDGFGTRRAVTRMRADLLTLRPCGPDDMGLVFDWANDPVTRAMAFSTDPIPWAEHERWFARRLADPASLFLIGEDDTEPIGQVRFDTSGGVAEISIVVAPSHRGRGIGPALLRAATDRRLAAGDDVVARGFVKVENSASLSAFRAADFDEVGRGPHGSVTFETSRRVSCPA